MSGAIETGSVLPLVPRRAAPEGLRRVALPDINEMAEWLVTRLQEKHPEATAGMILGWLRGCTSGNEWWFVRTENAWALAELRREPLEPQPYVREHFCLSMPEYQHEAADLYRPMASWAAHQNASRLEVMAHTDAARTAIVNRLGDMHSARYPYIRLGRLD